MKEEYNQNKIYKNSNPSSILDFIGKQLPNNNTQIMNSPLLNYTRKKGSIYKKQKFESNTSPRMTMLNNLKKMKKHLLLIQKMIIILSKEMKILLNHIEVLM